MGRASKSEHVEASINDRIESTLEEIHKKVKKAKTKNDKVNEALKAIKTQGERLVSNNGKLTHTNKLKLGALYDTSGKQLASEEDNLRKILLDIEKVRRLQFEKKRHGGQMRRGELMQFLQHQARSLPLWVGKVDGHPPPLVGGISLSTKEDLSSEDYVAAFVDDIWLMAEVKECLSSSKYIVRDIDDETDRTYTVKREQIISMPKYRADPQRDGHALFPKNAIVLALYPQTTCFYKGVVETVPIEATDDYQIAFEDPAYATGYSPPMPAPQGFVIGWKRDPVTSKNKKRKNKDEDNDD